METALVAVSRDPNTTQPDKTLRAEWTPGRYRLRDAWFPVAHLPAIGRRTVRRMVHSQPYFLWREGERVRAAEFPPEQLSERRRSDASIFTAGTGEYPLIEAYGYAWVWHGDPAHADEGLLPDIPYLPRKGHVPRFAQTTTRFSSSSELATENLIDLTHADFLHSFVTGNEESESDTVTCEATSETITMIRQRIRQKTPRFMKMMGIKSDHCDFRGVIHVYIRSGVSHAWGRYTPGFTVPLLHPAVPESAFRTRLNKTIHCWDAPLMFRLAMSQMNYRISAEDDSMLRWQSPRYLEPGERRDFHSPFDQPGNAYRRGLEQLAARQSAGDYSYLPDGNVGRDLCELLQTTRVDN